LIVFNSDSFRDLLADPVQLSTTQMMVDAAAAASSNGHIEQQQHRLIDQL
jgi:hypothetical protein